MPHYPLHLSKSQIHDLIKGSQITVLKKQMGKGSSAMKLTKNQLKSLAATGHLSLTPSQRAHHVQHGGALWNDAWSWVKDSAYPWVKKLLFGQSSKKGQEAAAAPEAPSSVRPSIATPSVSFSAPAPAPRLPKKPKASSSSPAPPPVPEWKGVPKAPKVPEWKTEGPAVPAWKGRAPAVPPWTGMPKPPQIPDWNTQGPPTAPWRGRAPAVPAWTGVPQPPRVPEWKNEGPPVPDWRGRPPTVPAWRGVPQPPHVPEWQGQPPPVPMWQVHVPPVIAEPPPPPIPAWNAKPVPPVLPVWKIPSDSKTHDSLPPLPPVVDDYPEWIPPFQDVEDDQVPALPTGPERFNFLSPDQIPAPPSFTSSYNNDLVSRLNRSIDDYKASRAKTSRNKIRANATSSDEGQQNIINAMRNRRKHIGDDDEVEGAGFSNFKRQVRRRRHY